MHYAAEALEKKLECLDELRSIYTGRSLRSGIIPSERLQYKTDIQALNFAKPFYLNDHTVDLVSAMAPSFKLDEIVADRDLLYADHGWLWFGNKSPFGVRLLGTLEEEVSPVRAISWYVFSSEQVGMYLGMTAYGQTTMENETGRWVGKLYPIIWSTNGLGSSMELNLESLQANFRGYWDDNTATECNKMRQFVLAMNTFVRQKLVSVQEVAPERMARKRIERAGHRSENISIVQLREITRKANQSGESREVDWSCRWTVAPHVRQQWYASIGKHLPVIIGGYIKGPEDKPFKPRSTPIYAVTR